MHLLRGCYDNLDKMATCYLIEVICSGCFDCVAVLMFMLRLSERCFHPLCSWMAAVCMSRPSLFSSPS